MMRQVEKGEIRTTTHICDFHKKNPGKTFAGCTCGATFTLEKPIQQR